jgi:hypothetical protein
MLKENARWCVLMSCSDAQNWALPQNALGEIVTLASETRQPPSQISWRGRPLPVLDLASPGSRPWRDARSGTGILAVILGLRGEPGDGWAVALRGGLLTVQVLEDHDLEDAPQELCENSTAAFRYRDRLFQVPDLQRWQQTLDPVSEEVA